jgi:hypothetical protein
MSLLPKRKLLNSLEGFEKFTKDVGGAFLVPRDYYN